MIILVLVCPFSLEYQVIMGWQNLKTWYSGNESASSSGTGDSTEPHSAQKDSIHTPDMKQLSPEEVEKKAESLASKYRNTNRRGTNNPKDSKNDEIIRDLEHRLHALEIQNLILWGTIVSACGITFARRNKQFKVKTLAADRLLLTHPTQSMFEKPAVAAEMTIRQGRPELRMLDGSVVLMDQQKHSRIQLDPSFRPAPAIVEPSLTAQKGMDRIRDWAGKPVLLFNRENEVPEAIMDASKGFVASKEFPRPAPERFQEDKVDKDSNDR